MREWLRYGQAMIAECIDKSAVFVREDEAETMLAASEAKVAEVCRERDRREANGIALFKAQARAESAEALLVEAREVLRYASKELHYTLSQEERWSIAVKVDALLTRLSQGGK